MSNFRDFEQINIELSQKLYSNELTEKLYNEGIKYDFYNSNNILTTAEQKSSAQGKNNEETENKSENDASPLLKEEDDESKDSHDHREARENSLDLTATEIVREDVEDYGESLFFEQDGKFRFQMNFKEVNEWEFKDILIDKTKNFDYDKHEGEDLHEELQKDISNHYIMSRIISQNELKRLEQEKEDEDKTLVNLSGWQFYFYYMVVFVTVEFFGPITALLLFCIPELRLANETKEISFFKWSYSLSGWQIPLFEFCQYSTLWSAGEGPMYLDYSTNGFISRNNILKADTPLQSFSRSALMMIFIYLARCVAISTFVLKSEIKKNEWKYEFWKAELQFDDGTFEFDLINETGTLEQIQVRGEKMLPHIKDHPITHRVISIMKFVVPCIFICIYQFKLGESLASNIQQFPDPKGYWNNTQGIFKGKQNLPMNAFGNGKRDFCMQIVGYIVEMNLIGHFYFLLFHTIVIHKEFYKYLYYLIQIQDYNASCEDLDNFYVQTLLEPYLEKEDAEKDYGKGKIPEHINCCKEVCNEIWECDYNNRSDHNTINQQLRTPIDMCNIKNISNLRILRQMSFRLYQPLAMQAQIIIIYMTIVFLFGSFVLFESLYSPGSSYSHFYGLYDPRTLYIYVISFTTFFLAPVVFTFMIIFFYEYLINTNIILQNEAWEGQMEDFQRLQAMRSHYFEEKHEDQTFTSNLNALIVIREQDEEDEEDDEDEDDDDDDEEEVYEEEDEDEIEKIEYEEESKEEEDDDDSQEELFEEDDEDEEKSEQTKKEALINLKDQWIIKKFYPKEKDKKTPKLKAVAMESDNPYYTYLVKRFVQDKGQEGEELYFLIEEYVQAYNRAISSMQGAGEQRRQIFYFFYTFTINRTFIDTMLILIFWQSYQILAKVIASSVTKAASVKE